MMMNCCQRCHRPLSNPASRKVGFGPVCAAIMGVKLEHDSAPVQPSLFPDTCPVRWGDADIVLSRDERGYAQVNVPHNLVHHSPTGFEWGYGGSGPADLALNILALFVPVQDAMRLHQQYKWDLIASFPREGGVITSASVREWIAAH